MRKFKDGDMKLRVVEEPNGKMTFQMYEGEDKSGCEIWEDVPEISRHEVYERKANNKEA